MFQVKFREAVYYLLFFVCTICCLSFISGCVSAPKKEIKSNKAIFYPSPPEPPRFQYLTSFKDQNDFQSDDSSALDIFVGGAKKENYQIKKPYGVAFYNGGLYMADNSTGNLYKWDLVNKNFAPLRGARGMGKLVQPINLTIDKNGNKYVCDPVRSQVIVYNKEDFYVKSYSYSEPWKPVDAEVYGNRLFVVDSTAGKGGVKVFDLDSGKYLETIGVTGPDNEKLGIAVSISFDPEGYLFVMDALKFRVSKYDRDGHYRGFLGGPGDSPGFFGRPRGVAVDRDGRIFAVDAAFDVVQVFAPNGQLLTYFGEKDGEPGSLSLPASIHINYDNVDLFTSYAAPDFEIEYLIFVTSQFNTEQAVNVYGYGKKKGISYPSDLEMYDELLEEVKKARDQR